MVNTFCIINFFCKMMAGDILTCFAKDKFTIESDSEFKCCAWLGGNVIVISIDMIHTRE